SRSMSSSSSSRRRIHAMLASTAPSAIATAIAHQSSAEATGPVSQTIALRLISILKVHSEDEQDVALDRVRGRGGDMGKVGDQGGVDGLPVEHRDPARALGDVVAELPGPRRARGARVEDRQ